MSDPQRQSALDLLKDPHLLERIVEDFDRCGLVGEDTNKLVGYIAATSRKLNRPLAVMIQSSSGTGKTTLMDAVLAMMPPEEQQHYTARTGQSLFYMDSVNLKHKILALAEEQGTQQASYALKLLQSDARLRIVTTGKAAHTGRNEAQTYEVQGPVAVLVTTTSASPDEELASRCLVLTVDESAGQTRAIHQQQRDAETLAGTLARRRRDAVVELHQNAQRLLRPLLVVNPLAQRLTFGDHRIRSRRDHMKYLTLIRAVALLHQYQRTVKSISHEGQSIEYIEATREDVDVAGRVADAVLGWDFDELPPQTRKLWALVDALVRQRSAALHIDRCNCRFSRRDLRRFTRWSQTQVRVHLDRLVDLEYITVHQGGRGQRFVYELLFDAGEGAEATGMPLYVVDPDSFGDDNLAGFSANLAGSWRGQSGPLAGTWRPNKNGASPDGTQAKRQSTVNTSASGQEAAHQNGSS